jgi:hypothetical protein
MVLHIHEVSARPGIARAATSTVAVGTSVGNEGRDGFATGHDLDRLSTIRRVVPILAKERNEVVALDIVIGLVTNVGKITSVRASAVHVTFGTVSIGVVVGAVSTAWCVRGVGRPTGQLPARTASAWCRSWDWSWARSRSWDWSWARSRSRSSSTVGTSSTAPSVLGAALAVRTDAIAARATATGSYTSTTAAMSAARSAPSVLADENGHKHDEG